MSTRRGINICVSHPKRELARSRERLAAAAAFRLSRVMIFHRNARVFAKRGKGGEDRTHTPPGTSPQFRPKRRVSD
ncbi:hypothetical protein EVAR_19077_1 [Eumeta japonica]|uniref:Uncharacterized protein n=1 Tax=Eumeta variegata TaxID=151549 RepID=A0A4C1UPG9_EUMVA|nr:hypothetical protein EVAR_19077_1 [Eumeta japonica]